MTEQVLALRRAIGMRIVPLLEKILYRLGLWTPRGLHEAVSEFVAVNARYWSPPKSHLRGRVLVEGHLAEYGPNYLFRTALAAKALQETANFDIDVVFNGFARRWSTAKRVYRSFHITSFIFLGSRYFLSNLRWRIVSAVFAVRVMRKLRKPEDILQLKYGGIGVGDLVYDDILKWSSLKTIERIDRHVRRAIRKSYYYYLQYEAVFARRRYSYYISTHSVYSEYGLLCRVALAHDVRVIETTDIQMSCYVDLGESTYHSGIRRSIVKALAQPQGASEAAYAAAEEALQKRLASQVKQLDAQKAYRGQIYTREALLEALGFQAERKIVFVLAHVFSDAPHTSSGMLHADYYQWLASTLSICSRAPEVDWVVKPHPSSELYGEQGMVESMVTALNADNVKLCPRDLNTRSLEWCADALITVHGTAGLEFACVGIPVVLAGQPFYRGFGFTIDSETAQEYERTLLGFGDVTPLTAQQRRDAMLVYGAWERLFDWNNPIITSDVLANVWGSEQARNLDAAYKIVSRNLRSADPRRIRLWSFVQSVVEGS